MSSTTFIWQPRYTLTPAIARELMEIEAARAVVENTPLPPAVEADCATGCGAVCSGVIPVAERVTFTAAYSVFS
jgi:hypothetical protein